MCGIAGIVAERPLPEGWAGLAEMTAALEHRGPDAEGLFEAPGIGLGHRRLAILDLSPAGAQPMRSRDGRFTIALNGEVFNYRELRAQLTAPLRSATDTEVLLEACAAWGLERALDCANGMFAFALWDHRERELALARDRCGEKPLVYFWDGATLAFASELKALSPFHTARLDPEAVDAYLALGYVPAPLSIFRDCRKLPPGHLLRFRAGRIEVRRWWLPEAASPPSMGPGQAEQLRELLAGAVSLRLRSDVPVALALSGGIDSSIVAAECVAAGARPEAFTVVFDADRSELANAELAARNFKLPHRVIRADADLYNKDPLSLAAAHYDEPFADSSAVPALHLAQAIAAYGGHKVVLTGDGGDEAFGGYRHYQHIGVKQWLKRLAAAAGIRDGSGAMGVYVESKSIFRREERARLLGSPAGANGGLAELLSSDGYLRTASGDALHRALWSDRHLYLPNDLTYKMDIALAAFGMEGRAPFLDHRVLNWAQRLPSGELVRGRRRKILLRRAYAGRLPEPLLEAPKRGFGAPIAKWLSGPLKNLVGQLLPCPLLERAPQRGASGQRLWTLAAFARWAQIWGARW